MLLLLRLPRRQPFVKLFLTDHFQHAVHFVMTEAAQFRASDFVIPGLNGREVHVNRQAGDGVLLEAHAWNKKLGITSSARKITSIARFTGTTMTTLTTSFFDAASWDSIPKTDSLPAAASSNSGLIHS